MISFDVNFICKSGTIKKSKEIQVQHNPLSKYCDIDSNINPKVFPTCITTRILKRELSLVNLSTEIGDHLTDLIIS